MSESKDYIEMAFRSIECFKKDGKLDAKELDSINKTRRSRRCNATQIAAIGEKNWRLIST